MAPLRTILRPVLRPVMNDLFHRYYAGGRSGPIQLTIDYTATQFDFKWKAPSTSTLVFHWGDGTTSSVAGQDDTLVTTTSAYSAAGTYDFWITGDVTDLTWIDISSQAFVSGDVSTWSELVLLTRIYAFSTSISGDVSGFASMTSAVYFRFNSTSVTFDGTDAWTSASATINLHDCSWTSTMVDNAIAALKTCTNCTINISGTNAHRTAASNDNLNTLLANGNTITLNDVLGAELHTTANAASDPNGNEADATTGWNQFGLDVGANVFESQSAVKSTGSYALHADANDTPTGACRFYINIAVENTAVYRVSFDWRHNGLGAAWFWWLNGEYKTSVTSSNITYATVVYYFTAGDTTATLTFREGNADNNGGVYVDNVSVKKVTFT